MLRKAIYPKIELIVNPLAEFLNQKGFTPNQLTLGGLALNLLSGLLFAMGAFFLGGLILIAAAFGDLLDGPLARVGKKETHFGAFLEVFFRDFGKLLIENHNPMPFGLFLHFTRIAVFPAF